MPSRLRVVVHHLREGRLAAAHPLGERDGRIVAGLDDHALDQDLRRHLRAHLHEGARAFRLPGVLA